MVQRRGRKRFLLEPAQAIRIAEERLREHLHCNIPAEAGVTGSIDLAHPTGAEGPTTSQAKPGAGGERHGEAG